MLRNREEDSVGTSPRWATNVIHACMGIELGERVLIAVDEPLCHALDPLLAEALEAGPSELWTHTFPNAARPFSEFPARFLDLAARMDVVVLLLAHVAAQSSISHGNPRYAVGAYIDRSILEHELSADYDQISRLTHSLADRLRGSSSLHVTTPLETELRLSVAGREWRTDTGILRGRGVYGNLPSGEVYVAPVEDSAEGILVVDKSLPGLRLAEPARLVFDKGRVVSIEGEPGATHLERAIREAERKPHG